MVPLTDRYTNQQYPTLTAQATTLKRVKILTPAQVINNVDNLWTKKPDTRKPQTIRASKRINTC
jgi:hypothetical protein